MIEVDCCIRLYVTETRFLQMLVEYRVDLVAELLLFMIQLNDGSGLSFPSIEEILVKTVEWKAIWFWFSPFIYGVISLWGMRRNAVKNV